MYTIFFGLRELPFPHTNDLHFFYPTPATRNAEKSIITALREHNGLVLLTGEPGTGKTTLLRRIVNSLEPHAWIISLPFSVLTFADILTYLCDQFAITPSSNDPFTKVLKIQEHLRTSTERRARVILCIDEAQNLHKDTLDRLRLLLHLKGPNGKLLQILLAGQLPLETKLAHPDLQHLQQYITVHCQLEPLSRNAVKSFILHRLCIAGYDRPALFTSESIQRIADYSQQIPRLINVICDNALIAAYMAGSQTVSVDLIEEVAKNLLLSNEARDDKEKETPTSSPVVQQPDGRSQLHSRHWLSNLVWTSVGIFFAWISSGQQPLFPSFSTAQKAPVPTASTSPVIPPVGSAILPLEYQVSLSPSPVHTNQETPNSNQLVSPIELPAPLQTAKEPSVSVKLEPSLSTATVQTQSNAHPHTPTQSVIFQEAKPPQPLLVVSAPASSPLRPSQMRGQPLQYPDHLQTPPHQRNADKTNAPLARVNALPTREALFRAVATNNMRKVELLLAARAPVNAKDERGWTALMVAVRENRPDLARLLLARGAQVNAKNKAGETALIQAANDNHPAIVQLLIDSGASIDTKDNLGWTPLIYAASKGHRLTVETLLHKGADAKVRDKDGRTASMYAARQGDIPLYKGQIQDPAVLQNRLDRSDQQRVKRREYSEIASLLKQAETKP